MITKIRSTIYSVKNTEVGILIIAAYILFTEFCFVRSGDSVPLAVARAVCVLIGVLIVPILDNFIFNLFSKASVSFKSVYYEFLTYNALIHLLSGILMMPSLLNFYNPYVTVIWFVAVNIITVITSGVFYADIYAKRYNGKKKVIVVLCVLGCIYYICKLYPLFRIEFWL